MPSFLFDVAAGRALEQTTEVEVFTWNDCEQRENSAKTTILTRKFMTKHDSVDLMPYFGSKAATAAEAMIVYENQFVIKL